MTQEEKQLLLKVLCEQLPYGIKILSTYGNGVVVENLSCINTKAMLGDYGPVPVINPVTEDITDGFEIEYIKQYLRPMSSMTEEEKKELSEKINEDFSLSKKALKDNDLTEAVDGFNKIDWFNAHHFDYHGLIEKGLALEAPDEMYKNIL